MENPAKLIDNRPRVCLIQVPEPVALNVTAKRSSTHTDEDADFDRYLARHNIGPATPEGQGWAALEGHTAA